MSTYPPPQMPLSATFNVSQWTSGSITASDLSNYCTLSTAQNITGIKSFNGGLTANSTLLVSSLGALRVAGASAYAEFSFAGGSNISLALPTSTGTIALVSQIPTSADFVDLTTNQSVGGDKTFNGQTNWNGGAFVAATGAFQIGSVSAAATISFSGLSNIVLDLPTTAGGLSSLVANQTITGNNTFVGQIVSNRASSATLAASPIYFNPSNTVMSAANNYRWTYLAAPPTSGSSTGTASTFTVAGPPSTPATNNYSAQIIAGQTSIPSGTVAAPSLVFGNSNGTGLYSSAANTVNVSVSGAVAATIDSTGTTLATALYANGNTFCRNSTGNYMLTRALKGVGTAVAGVVTFSMTQLNGSTFGTDSAGVFMVTMTIEDGDFVNPIGVDHGFWCALVERSAYSGGKANIVQVISAINASATITSAGVITVTVTAATSSTYAFTQMQICY